MREGSFVGSRVVRGFSGRSWVLGIVAALFAQTAEAGEGFVVPGDVSNPSDTCRRQTLWDIKGVSTPAGLFSEAVEVTAELSCDAYSDPSVGYVARAGDIFLNFGYAYIPTMAEVEALAAAVHRINSGLCDATDGMMRLARAHILAPTGFSDPDVTIFSPETHFRSTITAGDVGDVGARVIMGAPPSDWDLVFVHEFGHFAYDIGDSYYEPKVGRGAAFDGVAPGGARWLPLGLSGLNPTTHPWPGQINNPAFELSSDIEQFSSIMQQSTWRHCRNEDSLTPAQVNPLYWSSFNRSCDPDNPAAACTVPGFDRCPLEVPGYSEFSVQANFDLLRGGRPSEGILSYNQPHPLPQEARELVLSGLLDPTVTALSADGGTLRLTVPGCAGDDTGHGTGLQQYLGEECLSGTTASCNGPSGGAPLLVCGNNCLWDYSACAVPAGCGDGVVDPATEDCDFVPAAPPEERDCQELDADLLSGNLARCGSNCRWDRSACRTRSPRIPDELSTWVTPQPGEVIHYYDHLGQVVDITTSVHSLMVVPARRSETEYALHVFVSAADFDTPSDTDWRPIAVFLVEFDLVSGSLVAVNGISYTEGEPAAAQLLLGANSPSPQEGLSGYDGLMGGQYAATGRFVNDAPPLPIRLFFEELRLGTITAPDGVTQLATNIRGYARHGTTAEGLVIPQLGMCVEPGGSVEDYGDNPALPHCEIAYNGDTGDFETTAHAGGQLYARWLGCQSAPNKQGCLEELGEGGNTLESDWVTMARKMTGRYGLRNGGFPVQAPDFVRSTPPDVATCGTPIITPELSTLPTGLPARVVFALDTSERMGEGAVPFNMLGTRLDFAKASMRQMVANFDAHVNRNTNTVIRVGTTRFSSNAVPYSYLANRGTLELLGNGGSIGADGASDESILEGMYLGAKMGPLDFDRFHRDSDSSSEYPVAEGRGNGHGWGLYGALEGIGGTRSERRAIILLSSQLTERTLGLDGSGWQGQAPASQMIDRAAREGIELYLLDISTTQGLSLARASDLYSPNYWTLRNAEDTASALTEIEARIHGDSVVLSGWWAPPIEEVVVPGSGVTRYRPKWSLLVEEGADRLFLRLSRSLGLTYWEPDIILTDPLGAVLTPSMRCYSDVCDIVLDDPTPGLYTLAPDISGSLKTPSSPFPFVTSARIESGHHPRCLLTVDQAVVDDNEDVTITAAATYDGRPLGGPIEVTGHVRLPNERIESLTFSYDYFKQRAVAGFPASKFDGRGQYHVVASCAVAEGTLLEPGEAFHEPDFQPNKVPVPAFRRDATARFSVDSPDVGQLPPPDSRYAEDCDGDGIPNALEGTGDADLDGAPDMCDEDSDDDGLHDSTDPDPTVADPECGGLPEGISCCAGPASCGPLRDLGLWATRQLRLGDRIRVVTPDDQPAGIMAAAEPDASIWIGTDGYLGDLYSTGSVELRDRTKVLGGLWIGGELLEGNQLLLAGPVEEGAEVSAPSLASFDVVLPNETGPSHFLGPETMLTLPPGNYNRIDVHRAARLTFTPGSYTIRRLVVESQGLLRFEASSGPVRLFIGDELTWRGAMETVGGPEQLFVAYLGTGTAYLDAPWRTTLVAPNGKLLLASRPHEGAFFARDLEAYAGTTVTLRPFLYPWLP